MRRKNSSRVDFIIALQKLLHKNIVGTQEEIKCALQKQGFTVNQAKVSRILHKIGASKIKEGGQVVYRLATELVSISPNDSLKKTILNITHNESMIVIQTAPGCAQFVARFLNQSSNISILGSVASDNIIFVAPEKVKQIRNIYQKIYKLLFE